MAGDVEHVYEVTPIMSTYLLAWVVGEFDVLEDRTSSGTVVRVFTPPGKRDLGKFGLDCAVKILPFFTYHCCFIILCAVWITDVCVFVCGNGCSEYFGIGYPLTKCDLLSIPEFSAGAMEVRG